jgi:hypothetical protein
MFVGKTLTLIIQSLADERLQGRMGKWSLSGRDDCTEMFAKQVRATALVMVEPAMKDTA